MAASASDEGSAPIDFNLSSTIDDNESKSSNLKEKCSLCNNFKRTFYCKQCVRNGDFVGSTPHYPERFTDKKLRWLKLKYDKEMLAEKCLKMIQKKEQKKLLQFELRQCEERIKLLRQLIKEKNEVIEESSKVTDTVMEKNKSRLMRLPRYKERVEKLQGYVANNMKFEVRDRRVRLERARADLDKVVQKNIRDLVDYIFPISKILPVSKSEDEDTVSALAEATSTSYVRGKWVFTDCTGEVRHCIVAPALPGSGDYSAYSIWVATNKNGVPDTDKLEQNQAYSISAALCYATQLVNLIAYYLDVILPKKLSYSDFHSTELTDGQLAARVSKLNTNIMYLCFSQGVDTALLNPKHTLSNVLYLIKHGRLGHVEPFDVDSSLVVSLEAAGGCRKEDSEDSEDNDAFPLEWEAIPLVQCPECPPGSSAVSTHHLGDTTSVAGGLVTSLASIWRGWTGNR